MEVKLGRMQVENVWDMQEPQLSTPTKNGHNHCHPLNPRNNSNSLQIHESQLYDGPDQEKYRDEVSCAESENSELYNNEHNSQSSTKSLVSIVTSTISGHKILRKRYRDDIEMENKLAKKSRITNHRLIVLDEGKTSNTPKPRTPQLVNPTRAFSKKKWSWKRKDNRSTLEQEPAPISCRRVLNFNLLNEARVSGSQHVDTLESEESMKHKPIGCQSDSLLTVIPRWMSRKTRMSRKKPTVFRNLWSVKVDPTRKISSKTKVDFDQQTLQVSNLLMEKDGSESSEEENEHTKKWWEEQRELFRGRVESFIASMRLIQGDKQFSPWKGSVVDSVVGAFLTQNVSDKQSSSAFMSLAAHYPHSIKSTSRSTTDALDWNAISCAKVGEISKAIKERGMNKRLALRIKNCLNRLVQEHGSIDLEWLKKVSPEEAKEYLLSIEGLGLKSVECIRLLTLHHPAFPVDTNVGRIAIRLGWVPLQPLPEGLQFHLLEQYPSVNTIQKYLWPRLCTLDQRILYELHYQMITFGKVLCTKKNPNCKACPMRGVCQHYDSEFTSARLSLPQPQEKSIVPSNIPSASAESTALEANFSESVDQSKNWQPIVEVPPSPGYKCTEILERDIEDLLIEDEISTVELYTEEYVKNLKNFVDGNSVPRQEYDMSKLKNVSRLRTEHQVYVLPDSHPLLKGQAKREPGDICPYLLAIWIAEGCDSNILGEFCNANKQDIQTVPGTLLIPCRTAMKGRFPLNGTYFQVNEVFADDLTSHDPISVPITWIWNLLRTTLYCGTSVMTIFRDLSAEEIKHCFRRGFVCVRGFSKKRGATKTIPKRFHHAFRKMEKRERKKKK